METKASPQEGRYPVTDKIGVWEQRRYVAGFATCRSKWSGSALQPVPRVLSVDALQGFLLNCSRERRARVVHSRLGADLAGWCLTMAAAII